MNLSQGRPAAFIDRDGVINRDHGYVSRWEDFEFIPGVEAAMARLQQLGFAIVVVTNQSGIGRGYYDEAAFKALTAQMTDTLGARGVDVTGVYFCPHHPTKALGDYLKDCDCRKPAPGLLLRAAHDHQLALDQSIMIGDKLSDIEAGRAAGVARCYQVTDGASHGCAIRVASLAEAADQEAARPQNS